MDLSLIIGPILASLPPWFGGVALTCTGIFIIYRFCVAAKSSSSRTMFSEMRDEMSRLYDRVEKYESRIDEVARERDAARDYANELLHLIRNHLQVIQMLMLKQPDNGIKFDVREPPPLPWKTSRPPMPSERTPDQTP